MTPSKAHSQMGNVKSHLVCSKSQKAGNRVELPPTALPLVPLPPDRLTDRRDDVRTVTSSARLARLLQ